MEHRTNPLKHNGPEGRSYAGPVIQLASPEVVEMAGAAGFDFVWIDCEHGAMHLDQLVHMLRAADAVGLPALVRVPDQCASFMARVLDAGALGVIIPGIISAEQAAQAVAACRYRDGGNGGTRGACPGTRASWHQASDWPAFVRRANSEICVWLLIETPEAVEAIDRILDVPGLDGIVLGPFDLAQAMDLPGQVHHPEVEAAMRRVVDKTQSKGVSVVASLFSANANEMRAETQAWRAQGVQIFSIGSDRRLIMQGMRDRAHATQGIS